MKKTKYTESQIVFALKQAETGVKVAEVCRKMGISVARLYNRKRKYGGLGTSELRRLKQLEEENFQLKKIVADLTLAIIGYRLSGGYPKSRLHDERHRIAELVDQKGHQESQGLFKRQRRPQSRLSRHRGDFKEMDDADP